jgi:hypothetical protein
MRARMTITAVLEYDVNLAAYGGDVTFAAVRQIDEAQVGDDPMLFIDNPDTKITVKVEQIS